MAISAYSGVIQNVDAGDFNSSVDFMVQGQQAIQGKIDANKMAVQNVMSQYASIDLIREQDQQAFVSKAQGIIDMMNNSGNIDFTDNSISATLQANLSKALDRDTIAQINNTRKIREYQSVVNQKQKEGKGAYNEINDYYAVKQAGLNNYLRGDTDELGNLNYTDYIDVDSALREEVMKWGKEFGIETGVTADQSNSDFWSIVKSKTLSGAKVRDFVVGLVNNNPSYRKQILMNGVYNYQGVTDEQLNQAFTMDVERTLSGYGADLSRIETYRDKFGKDTQEYLEAEDRAEAYRGLIQQESAKLKVPFSREQYEYSLAFNSMADGIASTYQKHEVTDITFDDLPSRIRSRNLRDQIAIEDLEMKRQKLALDKRVASIQEGIYTSELPITPEDGQTKSNTQTATEQIAEGEERAIEIMRADPKYSGLDDQQLREKFLDIINTNPWDRTLGEGANSELLDVIGVVGPLLQIRAKQRESAYKDFDEKLFPQVYEEIRGGDVWAGNLSITAPNLAKAIQEDRPIESLDKETRAKIQYELLEYYAKSQSGIGSKGVAGEGNDTFSHAMEGLKKSNPNVKFDSMEPEGFWGNLGTSLSNTGTGFLKNAWSAVLNVVPYAGERRWDYNRKAQEDFSNTEWTKVGQAIRDRVSRILPDSTPHSINKYETKSKEKSITDYFRDYNQTQSQIYEQEVKNAMDSGLNFKQIAVISPTNKQEHASINTALSGYGQLPADTKQPMTISKDGDNINIRYIPDGKYTKLNKEDPSGMYVVASIPANQFPVNIFSSGTSWTDSPLNPHSSLHSESVHYRIPKNELEISRTMDKLHSYDPSIFTDANLESARNTSMLTATEYMRVGKMNGLSSDQVEQIINKDFVVKPIQQRNTTKVGVFERINGEDVFLEAYPMQGGYNSKIFPATTPNYINQYITEQIIEAKGQ